MVDWNQAATIITAIGTAALAIYAALTFRGIKGQMKLLYDQAAAMRRQADANEAQSSFIRDQSNAIMKQAETMESQFEVIREESATMKRQADAMEGQSNTMLDQAAAMKKQAEIMEKQSNIMFTNMEYDRLTKKYDRINKEMNLLIGQLYARRYDDQIFKLQKHSKRITYVRGNLNELTYDFVVFWESIDQNMNLNRSREFKIAYDNYNAVIETYFNTSEQEKDKLKEIFNRIKDDFIKAIETRYKELNNELKEIERELNIEEEKR